MLVSILNRTNLTHQLNTNVLKFKKFLQINNRNINHPIKLCWNQHRSLVIQMLYFYLITIYKKIYKNRLSLKEIQLLKDNHLPKISFNLNYFAMKKLNSGFLKSLILKRNCNFNRCRSNYDSLSAFLHKSGVINNPMCSCSSYEQDLNYIESWQIWKNFIYIYFD